MNTWPALLIFSFCVQAAAPFTVILSTNEDKRSAYFHSVLLTGLLLGITAVIAMFFAGQPGALSCGFEYFSIRLDAVSLFFLFIVQAVAIPVTIYSRPYLKHYSGEGRGISGQLVFYGILILSTQLMVVSDHGIAFLMCWEIMSMSAYLAMLFQKEKKDVQEGSFYYLIVNHVIMYLLFVFFFILHKETGTWYISAMRFTKAGAMPAPLLYALAFIAFGLKAGFMPLHFWLPKAHPIAPSTISAFLSGVMIKTGIYGLIRTFQVMSPVPAWVGWAVLVIGIISAVFGVWYALAQHDIKRLLAYHSVENIGIIGIGLGLGLIGISGGSAAAAALGFGGALLHCLNHAVFKTLLFLGSGVLDRNLHTRDIDLMGGIVHRAPLFVVLFLIGSVAISGVPPLNGFISELMIYIGLFTAAKDLHGIFPLIMMITAVGLALVGGLAVACFSKINSVMFLGAPRKRFEGSFSVSAPEYVSLSILALLCIAIGFFPAPFVKLAQGTAAISSEGMGIDWMLVTSIMISTAAGTVLFFWIKLMIEKKNGKRTAPSWACGYENVNERMQYTASSFADQINTIAGSALLYEKGMHEGKFGSHSRDLAEEKAVKPLYKAVERAVSFVRLFKSGDIREYVVSILVMITVYGLAAMIWA